MVNSETSSLLFSDNRLVISCFKILFNSAVVTNLSLATLASIRAIIFNVVSTPTSDDIKISSRLSRTSASTVVLPMITFAIFEKKLSFVFSNPLSKSSFFSLLKIQLNMLIQQYINSYQNKDEFVRKKTKTKIK